jgi:hypothetical protein
VRLLLATAGAVLFSAGFLGAGVAGRPDFCEKRPSHPHCQTTSSTTTTTVPTTSPPPTTTAPTSTVRANLWISPP